MRPLARADFGYGNTRLHARRADLLSRADYERLLDKDITGLLVALQTTPYASSAETAPHDASLRRLHDAIRAHLGRTLEEMRSFYTGRARQLVDRLLSSVDLHNVITVLRSQAGEHPGAETAHDALVNLGWLAEPLGGEILSRREPAAAVDALLREMPDRDQAAALRGAYREYERTANLAALERAVVADHAARSTAALAGAGPDAKTLLRFARREIDERNLLAVLRLRDTSAAITPEHALLPGGSVAPDDFAAAHRSSAPAAAAASLGALAARSWQSPLQRWASGGDLVALERELERRRLADAAALFIAGDPLAVDVPIAFTAAKQAEARNLRLLGEASVRGIPADTVREELLVLTGPA